MANYKIEEEHYNRSNERIDIQTQRDRMQKMIPALIHNLLKERISFPDCRRGRGMDCE